MVVSRLFGIVLTDIELSSARVCTITNTLWRGAECFGISSLFVI